MGVGIKYIHPFPPQEIFIIPINFSEQLDVINWELYFTFLRLQISFNVTMNPT